MKILLKSDIISAQVGDLIESRGTLKPISSISDKIPEGYITHLASKGIHHQFLSNSHKIEVVDHRNSLSSWGFAIRLKLESIIDKSNLSRNTRDFLCTVLLGDREYLDQNLKESFANAGVSHILALSGMHVAIIATMLMVLLFPLNLFGKYRIRILLTVIILIFYAIITGFQPSTIRSVLMSVCMLTALWYERKNTAWNSLLIATFIILLISPCSIMDLGLQLSFLSVASLIFFSRQLNPIDQHKHEYLYKIFSFIITTLVATCCIWILSAYFFEIIPLSFLAANILILPFLPVYMFAAVFYLLLSAGGINFSLLGSILDKVLSFWHTSIDWLTDNGNAVIRYSPSVEWVIAWLIIVGLFAIWINRPLPHRHI
ncbi:MAG: ComEC/Rec2 family competence protein [Muribaculaceae bacterium]|nr:ComEC/Rec2 family competence protein [Muribaculaceae bacterium]